MSIATLPIHAIPAPGKPSRAIPRAPRGGAVSPVNGRFYRGGCFMPRPTALPAPWPALAFDITAEDLEVTITNPATGNVRTFRVETIDGGDLNGKRMVALLVGPDPTNRWDWMGFGFADEFGIHPWRRFADKPAVAGPNGYIALLTESARFADRLEYSVSR